MPTYEEDLLARVVAIQIEAMQAIGVKADAKPYFYHTQGDFPYFTNRIADNPVSDDGSEEYEYNNPVVIMRLVVGHITQGYKGEPEARLYRWGPHIKAYFDERQWLTSAKYPTRMDNLMARTRVLNTGGMRAFQNDGIEALQVGRELQLTCTILEGIIEQDVY